MKCKICGTLIFKPRKSQKFCSNACRQENHRSTHGIQKPSFLGEIKTTEARKPIKIGYSNRVENLTAEYVTKRDEVNSYLNKLNHLETERAGLIARLKRVDNNTQNKMIYGGAGAAIGATLDKGWFGALVGGFGGLVLAEMTKDNIDIDRKTRNILIELAYINEAIKNQTIAVTQLKSELALIPRIKEKPILVKTVIAEEIIEAEPILALPKPNKTPNIVTVSELKEMSFKTLDFGGEWLKLLGTPQDNFAMCIHGEPFNGKSTFAINCAQYLADNFGKVLYNSSEEGFSVSLQKKLREINTKYMSISNVRTLSDLEQAIKENKCRFVFIDSINDMKITPEELQTLRHKFNKIAFIYILQATKDGKFKGGNQFSHDADIRIEIKEREPITHKNRFI